MRRAGKKTFGLDGTVLAVLLASALGSVAWLLYGMAGSAPNGEYAWRRAGGLAAVEPLDDGPLREAIARLSRPGQEPEGGSGLWVGELRVAAIGSAYPIPYGAEICPFSGMVQPSMDQLDRDGDGMTDEWELKCGLDKYDVADAAGDADEDGFTNLEEFRFGTDPRDALSHAPYAIKLRFVQRMDRDFPLIFKGSIKLIDGSRNYQLNRLSDGKTFFASLGEEVGGYRLLRVDGDHLLMGRGGLEIALPIGAIVTDPESQAELINILDRTTEIVTMGALLSLRTDQYMVLEVHSDKVVLQRQTTGELFEITGLAEGGH